MKKNIKTWLTLLLLLVSSFSACSRAAAPVQESPALPAQPALAWPTLALLRTGENPLWFELGSEGPIHIQSAAVADLMPFEPWPHARFISGMLLWEGFLVMAVNRDGFLVLGPGENSSEALLYRITDGDFWNPYTAESFFLYNNRPAVLLYRNDFFSEPIAPAPMPQVYVLDPYSPYPLGVNVPALEALPLPWEAEIVHMGPDGQWYYRKKEKIIEHGETAYFRSLSLSERGERISPEQWRASWPQEPQEPFTQAHLPALDEGFVYTAIAQFGDITVASWEEQQDAGIGASGFMLVNVKQQ